MKRLFLLGVAICMSWVLALATYGADVNCYGRVIDEQGEPLIGDGDGAWHKDRCFHRP